MATFTYSVPSGRTMYVGRPSPTLQWEQLTVAPHSRKVITQTGDGTNQTFDATKALIVEAQSPTTVSAIPYRAFSTFVLGGDGYVYYTGGLHSNYQGNEIDRLELPAHGSTVITTTISHQPNMPPEGKFSGFASGNGGYPWRVYDGGLADNSDWQPYPGHQWTKNGWTPAWGFFSLTAHALQASYPNGSYTTSGGLIVSSAAQPGDDYGDQEENWGIVGFDYATGKYKTYFSTSTLSFPQTYLGQSGVSDWNADEEEILLFQKNSSVTYIQRWTSAAGLVSLSSTSLITGYDGQGGDGWLVRHLEGDKYLILVQDTQGGVNRRIWTYSESAGSGNDRFSELTFPSAHTSDVAVTSAYSYTVDKAGRRVFWLVFPDVEVPVRIYVSSFDDLMNWTEREQDVPFEIPDVAYADAWLAGCRQPMHYIDGYLHMFHSGNGSGPNDPGYNNGAINSWRAYAGEAA